MKEVKKHLLVLMLLVVFFLVIFKIIYGPGTASKMDNLFRFHNCLELLEEDKLYTQYACWHGPIMYYTYYLFKVIFGTYFVLISTAVLNALALFAVLYLIWKVTNKNKFIIPILLYLALIIPLIADFFSIAAETVASIYMLFGVILLQYWKSKYKPFFASLLFTMSILSSQAALAPIAIFLAIYFLDVIKKPYIKNTIYLIKSNFNQLIYILVPIVGLNALFNWLHKDFVRFVYLGFAAAKTTSFPTAIAQTITAFATPNLVKLPLTVMLVVALYSLFRNRNRYLTTFFFGILAFTIISVRAYPVSELFDVYILYSNKFIVSIVFFIIGFCIMMDKLNLHPKAVVELATK